MASAILHSLLACSKPAVTSAAGSGGAGGAQTAAGAPSSGGPGTASVAGSAASGAPGTIGDFLAMLSGMIVSPAVAEGGGAPAMTVIMNPQTAKPADSTDSSKDDASQLYTQLLAFLQGGSAVDVTASADAKASAATGQPAEAAQVSTAAQSASAILTALQSGTANQRQLIAKLLGQSQTDGEEAQLASAGEPLAAPSSDHNKDLASTLQSGFQSLLSGDSQASAAAGSGSRSLATLQDLAALLSQTSGASSAATTSAPQQTDPSLLQSALAATAGTAPAAPAPGAPSADGAAQHLRAPVGTAAWTEQLGTHLTWMAANDQQSASLKLTPPHLGPLEVQITMGDDNKASVWFSAPHADTRAALGEALPRLRELFGAGGLTLGDANVSREPSRQNTRPSNPDALGGQLSIDSNDTAIDGSARLAELHSGLLDTYA
jgi:flagellar hook-length control protein FliK